jgi:ATP-dependent helicase HepA
LDDFVPGQRWVSTSELQLGLGTILSVEHRRISILFLSTGDTRIYARESAPLSRVRFSPGDRVRTHEGWTLHVERVSESQGLLTYHGRRDDDTQTPARIDEGQLDNFIQLSGPAERLFTGQIDPDKWFELRYQTLQHGNRIRHERMYGLCGGRTSLIPHQLYIAAEVAGRYAPRVLLADEVGLGKTIEAGMILHQQLLSGRAGRVLIVVPETLVHQWLVEMLRRFNLQFSIFDEGRWRAETEGDLDAEDHRPPTDNPFHGEQLILCSLDFLCTDDDRFEQALAGEWDLLIVDEAHHLQWTPTHVSREYHCIARLSTSTKGVLLLTATPEQLGKAGHFARLRLLDPDRFPDYDRFVAEEQRFAPLATAIEDLLDMSSADNEHPGTQTLETLRTACAEPDNRRLLAVIQNPAAGDERYQARDELVAHLLDRHGTGRVLFRNTRAAIQGFPQRRLHAQPLPAPDEYRRPVPADQPLHFHLSPELAYQAGVADGDWTGIDPRIDWLIELLQRENRQKVLLITATASTALDITTALRTRAGIHAAVFHEGLSIIERDRAAAFFADRDYGSQVLVCSEIGSEGRNFQFAHHVVLFDLPLNPDLLEQRIGRLDRIGQQQTIHIHIPYLDGTAQAGLFRWYHEGLAAFEQPCPAGHSVYVQMEAPLVALLTATSDEAGELDALLDETRARLQTANAMLQHGRDRLLEYNSCRPQPAAALKQAAEEHDVRERENLMTYLGAVFDNFGIPSDDHSEGCQVIRSGEHMQISGLPGLTSDGLLITYDRDIALAHEDIQFLTWEHPLTVAVMESLTSNELGNTAMTTCHYSRVTTGTLLLECLYVLEPVGAQATLVGLQLPSDTLRLVIDQNGDYHENALAHEDIRSPGGTLTTETRLKVIQARMESLRLMFERCGQRAFDMAGHRLEEIHQRLDNQLLDELNRLQALQAINPNIRDDELDHFVAQRDGLTRIVATARPRLDAARVIITV